MFSTCHRARRDNPQGFWPGLVAIELQIEPINVDCRPILDGNPGGNRMVPFAVWWDSEIVYYNAGRKIKRRQLVLLTFT
jgi:hypothetical protein